MNLIALNPDSLAFGQPLPFAVRGADGVLLASKGFVIRKREDLDAMLERGTQRDMEAWAESAILRISQHTFAIDNKTLSAILSPRRE